MSLRDDSEQFGTTVGATAVSFDSCTSTVQTGGRGVWYKVEGTGRPMRVSTCDTSADLIFDPQITMFQNVVTSMYVSVETMMERMKLVVFKLVSLGYLSWERLIFYVSTSRSPSTMKETSMKRWEVVSLTLPWRRLWKMTFARDLLQLILLVIRR